MTDDRHLDGNALGGLLIEVFGREMTDARGCCDGCGAVSVLGALLAYTDAPGDVMRCPGCGTAMLVAVGVPGGVRFNMAAVRWVEVATG